VSPIALLAAASLPDLERDWLHNANVTELELAIRREAAGGEDDGAIDAVLDECREYAATHGIAARELLRAAEGRIR
jgi:hypothetical protein